MPERDRGPKSDAYAAHRGGERARGAPRPAERHQPHDRRFADDGDRGRGDVRRGESPGRKETARAASAGPPAHGDGRHPGAGPSGGWYTEAPTFSSEGERHSVQHRQALYNLRYILTSRGLCQVMEVFVNLLIVICAGVPYSNLGGYRDLASLGGLYHYYYGGANAFTGADADRVKELDRLFHELKRPPYVFTMACGGALMAYACVMLALGVFRVPYRWPPVLLGEALANLLIGLGYVPALAFYFLKLQDTYNNSICKEREQMYADKGHQGFKCQFHGADIAAGLFGVLGVIVFVFGAVLAVKAFRSVRELKRELQ